MHCPGEVPPRMALSNPIMCDLTRKVVEYAWGQLGKFSESVNVLLNCNFLNLTDLHIVLNPYFMVYLVTL